MQQNGRPDKREVYKRDILRDYALAAAVLEEQFSRFQKSGAISFSILQGVLGESFSKGLLWHLKDTAHHLFAHSESTSLEGQYLDWTIGFLFHECMIMLESSYQLQKYYPAAQSFASNSPDATLCGDDSCMLGVRDSLGKLAGDTQANLAQMIIRIRQLMGAINRLMCAYLKGESNNRPLARLIYDREELLRFVFGGLYEDLLQSIFGPQQEKAVLEAAISLFESGHMARAARAAEKALAMNPGCVESTELLDRIAQMRQ